MSIPPNGDVGHKAFIGGSGRRAGAHTHPAFSKNAYGLVGIPLIMGGSGAGNNPQGVKAWREAPPEAEGNLQVPRHTRPDPCRRKHRRPKCYPARGEVQTDIDMQYLLLAPPNGQVRHKSVILGGYGRRAGAHARPTFPKMPMAQSALGAPQAPGDDPPKGVKECEEGPLRPKEISRYWYTLGQISAADNTGGRSATRQLERSDRWWSASLAAKSLSINNGEKSPL